MSALVHRDGAGARAGTAAEGEVLVEAGQTGATRRLVRAALAPACADARLAQAGGAARGHAAGPRAAVGGAGAHRPLGLTRRRLSAGAIEAGLRAALRVRLAALTVGGAADAGIVERRRRGDAAVE